MANDPWDSYWSRAEEDYFGGEDEDENRADDSPEPDDCNGPIAGDPNDYWPRELEADLLADMEETNDNA
jgi:hypothetical protein